MLILIYTRKKCKSNFKDNKSRAERYNPMSGSRFSITDYETKNTLVLIDNPMLGKEYQLKKESSFKEVLKDAEVEEGDKAIFFLGYTCKQYLIKKEGVLYWRYT